MFNTLNLCSTGWESGIGLSTYLMEEGRQEEDSWLAGHFTKPSPQQGLVEMASGQMDGLMDR